MSGGLSFYDYDPLDGSLPASFAPTPGHPVHGHLVVRKVGANATVSTEMLPMRIGRTRDEEYVHAVSVEWGRAEAAAHEQALAKLWTELLLLSDLDQPMLLVLQLHGPDFEARSWPSCRECNGTEMDPADWPCKTITTAAEWYGIEVPA